MARNAVIAETVKIVSSSLMGMTVGCAECHDHRYDPIPQSDYYRLRAIFDPALDWKHWKSPKQRLVSLYTAEDRRRAAEIEAEAKKIDRKRSKKQAKFIAETFEKELAKLPEEIRGEAREAYETAADARTDAQEALLREYPSLNVSAGSLYLYNRAAADELKRLANEAKSVRSRKPPEEFVRALVEPSKDRSDSFLFVRGDHEQPGQAVAPAGLKVVSLNAPVPDIPADSDAVSTSGRRSAFARRLTHPDHPLFARVIVNRIWMHHFGRGLVTTPADFGKLGSPSSHPELLDWLASEFVDSGWSVKRIHRLILTSSAYRQDLQTDSRHREVDPDNRLLGGARLRRLDAETLRDAALTAAGKLFREVGGPPTPRHGPTASAAGCSGSKTLNAGRPGKEIPLGKREYRRSVYVEVRRSRPLAVLDTFDWPRMDPNCERRRTSTVATQSLMLMNSDFVVEVADAFAERVIREAGGRAEDQIERVWRIAYGRIPTADETRGRGRVSTTPA